MSASDDTRILEEMMASLKSPSPKDSAQGDARKERIALFNKVADENMKRFSLFEQTLDFNRKQVRANRNDFIPHSSLRPISLEELEVGKTHRGCVIYCQIATRVLQYASAMVLVEDESGIKDLAVYGDCDRNDLRMGRRIAIREPFYKIRHDGTEGIRIDDPARDLVFDPPEHVNVPKTFTATQTQELPPQKKTVEERIQTILQEDGLMGAEKIYSQLKEEGYSISKKRVRALKRSIQSNIIEKAESDDYEYKIIPIISERQPDKHRILSIPAVFENKRAGNEAFKRQSFKAADEFYSKAIECRNDQPEESTEEVALWQLYCNRAAARLKLGLLHEALADGLKSNICAPADAVKPLLRCAEILASLGLTKEATDLLDSACIKFPGSRRLLENKKQNILPKVCLQVGRDSKFTTIGDAIRHAPSGAEILVDAGIYQEPLIITKPVTLRCNNVNDHDAVDSLEGCGSKNKWAEIHAVGVPTIRCSLDPSYSGHQIHIIGFKITCDASALMSLHALSINNGVVLCRNCIITSSSGPIVGAQFQGKIVMQACAVHGGAQGGILAADGGHISLHQVHCCRNAAAGLELRSKGSAFVEGCHFYGNGRQGIMTWKSAGSLIAKDCEIHSQQTESGILVSESEAYLKSCKVYGNGGAGIVSQQKGFLRAVNCEVHNNCEGLLIQDTGSAYVHKCKVYSNRANGIFVGFDHRGNATLIENEVRDNQSRGVLLGTSRNVVVRGNTESNNLCLPPSLPRMVDPVKQGKASKKYIRRVKKNKDGQEKAAKEDSFLNDLLKGSGFNAFDVQDSMMDTFFHILQGQCLFCHALPSEGKLFSTCSRCKRVSYCSKECQKKDWPSHKKHCFDKSVKYPSFVDPNSSV